MSSKTLDLLKKVIDVQHGGNSTYVHSVALHRKPQRSDSWDGMVHVFAVSGHPQAEKAFAWSAPIEGSASSRFFAVLQQGSIKDPIDAVKAVLKAIRAQG